MDVIVNRYLELFCWVFFHKLIEFQNFDVHNLSFRRLPLFPQWCPVFMSVWCDVRRIFCNTNKPSCVPLKNYIFVQSAMRLHSDHQKTENTTDRL